MKGTDYTGMAYLVVIGVVGLVAYSIYKKGGAIVQTAGDVVTAVNPLNSDNVFAKGANAVVQSVTGDNTQTLGGWIYDLTHPAFDPNADVKKAGVVTPSAIATWTTADQEDAEAGFMFNNAGASLFTAADQEDADAAYYTPNTTAGGAFLGYTRTLKK